MNEARVRHLAELLFCALLLGGALFLALRYLLPCILPFLVAYLLSRAVLPAARRLSRRLPLSERVLAPILLLLLFSGVLLALGLSARRLFLEVGELVEGFFATEDPVVGVEQLLLRLEAFLARFGLRGEGHAEALGEMLSTALESLVSSLSAALPRIAGRVLSALPGILLVSVITVIAGFYFCVDGDRLSKRLVSHLPAGLQEAIPRWRAMTRRLSWRYLRAYLILLGITLLVLFLGFSVLGVRYAFLLALLTALVDMLPILGVGTVLLPWAAVMLLQKKMFLGVGLLILYGVMLLLRQILEPRLVGKSLGLSPLLTLFAGYAGFRLFGVLGMILGPPVLMLARLAIPAVRRAGGTGGEEQ